MQEDPDRADETDRAALRAEAESRLLHDLLEESRRLGAESARTLDAVVQKIRSLQ